MDDKILDIIPTFTGTKKHTLCFKTGQGSMEDFSALGPSALRQLHERIVLGDTFPSQMILNRANHPDFALAYLLFRTPRLALSPRTTELVNAMSIYIRMGVLGLSLLPERERDLIRRLQEDLLEPDEPVKLQFEALENAASLLEEDIRLNSLSEGTPEDLEILDEISGFLVRYTSDRDSYLPHVYRAGYMGGLWQGPVMSLIFKRSLLFRGFPLDNILRILNDTLPHMKGVWVLADQGATLLSRRPLTDEENQSTWDAIETFFKGMLE